MRGIAVAAVLCGVVCAQRLELTASAEFPEGQVRGAALAGDTLYLWGDGVRSARLPRLGEPTTTLRSESFGPGGCAGDLEGDQRTDLVLNRRAAGHLGEIVRLNPRSRVTEEIDTGSEFGDCLIVTLFGRRGVLLIHRGVQLRFYEPPAPGASRWSYREIYSIYTPSYQAGLLLGDVDRDGRVDIYCGNYWVKSPATFAAPWHIFAINSWWDGPKSASLRLAMWRQQRDDAAALVAAQLEVTPPRAAVFTRPEDPRKFWHEQPLTADPPFRAIGALLATPRTLFVAENSGEGSRVIVFESRKGRPQGGTAAVTRGLFGLWNSAAGILGVGVRQAVLYTYLDRK